MFKCLNVFTELFHYNLSRYLWTVVTSAPRRNLGTTNLWLRDAPGRAPAAGSRDRHRPRAARLTLSWPGFTSEPVTSGDGPGPVRPETRARERCRHH